jgi:hypothetical protein
MGTYNNPFLMASTPSTSLGEEREKELLEMPRNNFRRMKMKYTFIAFLLLLTVQASNAQNFVIQRIVHSSDDISVYYDLFDDNKNQKYFIQVFSSTNNYSSPLQKVTGDVGIDVKPGISQRIVWNIKEELGKDFVGDIQLEIRGKVYVPFMVMANIGANHIFKRAKPTELFWTGDSATTY